MPDVLCHYGTVTVSLSLRWLTSRISVEDRCELRSVDLSPTPLPFKMDVPGIGGPMITKGAWRSSAERSTILRGPMTSPAETIVGKPPAGRRAGNANDHYWSEASGRQFVVVVAGGHGSTSAEAGNSIIAYALPKS